MSEIYSTSEITRICSVLDIKEGRDDVSYSKFSYSLSKEKYYDEFKGKKYISIRGYDSYYSITIVVMKLEETPISDTETVFNKHIKFKRRAGERFDYFFNKMLNAVKKYYEVIK